MGCTHQYSAHGINRSSSVGRSILWAGDPTSAWKPVRDLKGQLLHAKTLGFQHPNGESMRSIQRFRVIFREFDLLEYRQTGAHMSDKILKDFIPDLPDIAVIGIEGSTCLRVARNFQHKKRSEMYTYAIGFMALSIKN